MPLAALRAFALGASLLAAGCDEPAENRSVADLAKRAVTVGGQPFEMALPAKAVLTARAGVAKVDFAPGARQPRTIELKLADATAAPAVPKATTRRLPSGALLTYRVRMTGGGSGGAEATLIGRLTFGTLALAVTCHSQAEFGLIGDWCVPYLGSMRRKDR